MNLKSQFPTRLKSRVPLRNYYGGAKNYQLEAEFVGRATFLETFLPQKMTKEEIEKAAKSTITELEASSMKDMGRVMSQLKENFGAKLDSKQASIFVKKFLC